MIETKDLIYQYTTDRNFQYKDIKSSTSPLLIIGPSGSGKTTFLHLLAGLLKPKSGSITWNGININQLSESEADKLRGQKLGMIFQKPHFIPSLTVKENILLPSEIINLAVDHKQVQYSVEQLGIEHLLRKKIQTLSEGEKQRVSIARALIHNPDFILADEPTSSLDDHNAFQVAELLNQVSSNSGAHLLIITHDQRLKSMYEQKIELI